MATGCGCMEVYRFPHTAYPYSSCICSFLQQHPYFLFIFKMYMYIIALALHSGVLQSKAGCILVRG